MNRLSRMAGATAADAVAPIYLLLCLLLGGSSSGGVAANALLQLLALTLLTGFALRPPANRNLLGTRGFAILAGATAALVLYQLVPLPGALWTELPGRGDVVRGYGLLGMAPPGLSLSLDTDATIAAGLSLLPPLAMAVAAIHGSSISRLFSVGVILGVTLLSTLVGALQLSGGEQSPLYFYTLTSINKAVGLFANSNHLATLFLISLPCVAALAAREREPRRRRRISGRLAGFIGLALFFCFGLLLNRSLAGLTMLLPVLFACFALWRRNTQKPLRGWQVGAGAIVAAVILAVAFAGPLSGRIGDKLANKDPVTRRTTNRLTFKAAADHLPFGTGLGSFVSVYPAYEKPETVTWTYVNHAHDDYAELALEAGLPGLALLFAWLAWLARRSRDVWSGDGAAGSMARAGSVIIGIVLVHSLVDYPARTAAIAAVLGFAFGLLAMPVARNVNSASVPAGRHARAT